MNITVFTRGMEANKRNSGSRNEGKTGHLLLRFLGTECRPRARATWHGMASRHCRGSAGCCRCRCRRRGGRRAAGRAGGPTAAVGEPPLDAAGVEAVPPGWHGAHGVPVRELGQADGAVGRGARQLRPCRRVHQHQKRRRRLHRRRFPGSAAAPPFL